MGAITSFNMDPKYGHEYPFDTIAGDVSNWCYKRRGGFGGIGGTVLRDYHYEKGNTEYYNEGYFRKFD
jgi:hypothetical protein